MRAIWRRTDWWFALGLAVMLGSTLLMLWLMAVFAVPVEMWAINAWEQWRVL